MVHERNFKATWSFHEEEFYADNYIARPWRLLSALILPRYDYVDNLNGYVTRACELEIERFQVTLLFELHEVAFVFLFSFCIVEMCIIGLRIFRRKLDSFVS